MESWFWPTLEHCGQLQKFCGTLADQYNIVSGHIYNIKSDLHQIINWFIRFEHCMPFTHSYLKYIHLNIYTYETKVWQLGGVW